MIRYIGALGAGILFLAFVLLEWNKLSREKIGFHLLNFIGSALLFGYAYSIKSYIFVVLNVLWVFVAVYEIQKLGRN